MFNDIARGATGKKLVFQMEGGLGEIPLNVISEEERQQFEAEKRKLAEALEDSGDVSPITKKLPRPLGDIVLVLPDGESVEQEGALFVARQKPETGLALAVGKDVVEVAAGDKIAYSRYSGGEYIVDDTKLLTISEKDIVLIL